jgi:hypothetical protein
MDERKVYSAPRVMKIQDLKTGEGLCATGSGDAEGCTAGRTARGMTGCTPGQTAFANCNGDGSSAQGECYRNGASAAELMCSPGSALRLPGCALQGQNWG